MRRFTKDNWEHHPAEPRFISRRSFIKMAGLSAFATVSLPALNIQNLAETTSPFASTMPPQGAAVNILALDNPTVAVQTAIAPTDIAVSLPINAGSIYRISSLQAPDICLGVSDNSRKSGAAVAAQSYTELLGQKFMAVKVDAQNYAFQIINSGQYLTVSGTTIIQKASSAGPDKYQIWQLSSTGGGLQFFNLASGNFLSYTQNGGLGLSQSIVSTTNLFTVTEVFAMANGFYRLYTADGGYLSVKNNSIADGAACVLAEKGAALAMIWKVGTSAKGTVRFTNGNSQKSPEVIVIDAAGNQRLQQWVPRADKSQHFAIVPAEGGWFIVKTGLKTYLAAANGLPGATMKATTDKAKALRLRFSPAAYATSIKLDAHRMLLAKAGDTLQLQASVYPNKQVIGAADFRSSNEAIATVSSSGKVKAKAYGECTISVKVNGHTDKCNVVVANKWAALTFDDGSGSYTGQLLDTLKKYKVNATFFVLGNMAATRKPLLVRMANEGHVVGNHTYNHNGSASALAGELSRTDAVIKSAIGHNAALMRPPGGSVNAATRSCGKPIILWSVDPRDWADRNTTTVYNRVTSAVRSGAIILLHDIHPTTVAAVPKIITTLKSWGYAFVTVPELLGNTTAGVVYGQGASVPRTMKFLG